MLTPEDMLRHARRLLTATADEADMRRAISACYYAIFNLLITAATETQTGASSAVQDSIRRSISHSSVRKVCNAVAMQHPSRPLALRHLFVEPVNPDLLDMANGFIELQQGRLEADYDLGLVIDPVVAGLRLELAEVLLGTWPALLPDQNTRTFLLALLFIERWSGRA